jgi:hypothetical protein
MTYFAKLTKKYLLMFDCLIEEIKSYFGNILNILNISNIFYHFYLFYFKNIKMKNFLVIISATVKQNNFDLQTIKRK